MTTPAQDRTFRDLLHDLATARDLPRARQRHWACSVRRTARALDRRPEDLPAVWIGDSVAG
jgi:hypothetical protein